MNGVRWILWACSVSTQYQTILKRPGKLSRIWQNNDGFGEVYTISWSRSGAIKSCQRNDSLLAQSCSSVNMGNEESCAKSSSIAQHLFCSGSCFGIYYVGSVRHERWHNNERKLDKKPELLPKVGAIECCRLCFNVKLRKLISLQSTPHWQIKSAVCILKGTYLEETVKLSALMFGKDT